MVLHEDWDKDVPDLRMDLFLSKIGVEVILYCNGVLIHSHCRDYKSSYEENELIELYVKKLLQTLKRLRSKL